VTFSPDIPGLGRGNYRIGYEHRDEVPGRDRPADEAFYLNIDQEIAKDVAPFLRIGWGTGRSTGVAVASSLGIGIDNCFGRPGDAFGFGIGFDTANDREGEQRETEYVSETFYRFQLTRAMQWTLGGQVIVQPVNAPHDDVVGVFETRLVIDF
jgi:carbohydrate-selective porin OprB